MTRDRLVLAYAVAPLTTSPVLTAVGAIYAARDMAWSAILEGIEYPLFFFSIFGIPLAYLIEFLLVVLVQAVGLRPATIGRRWIVALGVCAGAVVFGGLFHGPTLAETLEMAGVGGLMGAAASTTFALVRGRSDGHSWAV